MFMNSHIYTGIGMNSEDARILCCDVFSTTKRSFTHLPDSTSALESNHNNSTQYYGQFGVGLKGAIFYAQQHLSQLSSCFSVSTTKNARNGSCSFMEFYIDDDTTIVRKQMEFEIEELKNVDFCGTEVRIKFPLCSANILATVKRDIGQYLLHLRYFAVNEIEIEFQKQRIHLSPRHRQQYVMNDFGCMEHEIAHCKYEMNQLIIEIIAMITTMDVCEDESLFKDITKKEKKMVLPVKLVRFANAIPLPNDGNVVDCSITKALLTMRKTWKQHGYQCKSHSSTKFPILLSSPCHPTNPGVELVLLINLKAPKLHYANLTKSTISNDLMIPSIQEACSAITIALEGKFPSLFQSSESHLQQEIIQEYIPLISECYANIAASRFCSSSNGIGAAQLHEIIQNRLNERFMNQN